MYKIYAIRYAERDGGTRSSDFYMATDPLAAHKLTYFMWVVIGDDGDSYVIDAGFTPEAGARRNRPVTCDVLAVMRTLGVDIENQRDVVLTHLHWDHVGHIRSFPNAKFWLQEKEMAFWTGPDATRYGYIQTIEADDIVTLVKLNFEGRLKFLDGPATLAPGITLHPIGGHSPGMQVVRIDTGEGVVLLASDAAHFYENLEPDKPFAIIHSLADQHRATEQMHELVDSRANIVPGHDPLVLERYSAPTPELAGHVVEIKAV